MQRVQHIDKAWWLQPEKDEELTSDALPSEVLGEVPASPQGDVPPQQRCPLCLSRCANLLSYCYRVIHQRMPAGALIPLCTDKNQVLWLSNVCTHF